jgi:malonate decarboxylase delta subunit
MPLEQIDFEHVGNWEPGLGRKPEWDTSHVGFVGSGDLEILAKRLSGALTESRVHITTSVVGYETLWKRVISGFLERHRLEGLEMWINDNGATPAVVRLRLEQLLQEGRARRDGK